MNTARRFTSAARWGAAFVAILAGYTQDVQANSNVKVSRFWHNHQPIYWPEWNSAPQNERVQFAKDSINLKSGQTYDSDSAHPENDLDAIFGVDDRKNAYQSGPRNSLASVTASGGYAMSYSGSLMNNVHGLGAAGHSGYGSDWWNGNREARTWTTPAGSPRMDLVGFTYHHSLGAVLPKEVLRKEIQIFKEAAYKAWNTGSVTNHSKGFFPTEMAFTRHMIDVLVDEGFEWVIVPSHHLSRTSPTWSQKANPEGSYGIHSSPPNKADQLGPTVNDGWWYGSGQIEPIKAWNLVPYSYQLHKAKHVNPETGVEKSIILVPSDDVLSYQYGYIDEGTSKIGTYISPFATDPARPCLVMPATDGDNAWGGGSSSWDGAAPALMNNGTYPAVAVQDFVNQFGGAADTVHIEDGAWIFPESDWGSANFLKWVEPPSANATATNRVYNTNIDIETPGFAVKFFNWAPIISGANWCQTAEQMTNSEGGGVASWKVQDPYDNLNSGTYSSPNLAERAWHIYLAGLDSGFSYYGGENNDDEVKTSLATRRAVELLSTYVNGRKATLDHTPPSVFKPQRFPYNPGWYTFGWFNKFPGNDGYLKKMRSEFYVWTFAYDLSGITNIVLKVRKDGDGVNTMANNQNETYAGGSDVGSWVSIAMTKRILPNTASALTAAANTGGVKYFSQALSPEVADYYWAKVSDATVPDFRGKLLDYYIEAHDGRGNLHKSDIQHVWVEDDGEGGATVGFSADPRDCAPLAVTYTATGGALEGVSPVYQQISFNNGTNWTRQEMVGGANVWVFTNTVPDNAPTALVWFENSSGSIVDSNGGANWSVNVRDCDAPVFSNGVSLNPTPPVAGQSVTVTYDPAGRVLASATSVNIHHGYNGANWTTAPGVPMTPSGSFWTYSYTIPVAATNIMMAFNQNGQDPWDNNGGQDWKFTVTPAGEQPVPDGVAITNPAVATVTVANAVSSYTVQGTAGTNLTGDLMWTNTATELAGTFARTTPWSRSVDLAVGDNVISISAGIAPSGVEKSTATVKIIREEAVIPVPDGVVITNPAVGAVTVANAVSSYNLQGTAGANLAGDLMWTNTLTGLSGSFARQTYWNIALGLDVGANPIRISGLIAGSGADVITNASDSAAAAAYGGGWTNGSNGGTGFGGWAFNHAQGTGYAGVFIANPTNTGITGLGTSAFGFYANPPGSGANAEVLRDLSSPLGVGSTLQFDLGLNWDSNVEGSYRGFSLLAGDTELISINMGNSQVITINGATMLAEYGTQAISLRFDYLASGSIRVRATGRNGSESYDQTLAVPAGAPSRIKFFFNATDSADQRQMYFNNLMITSLSDGEETYSTATVTITRESSGEPPPPIPPISFEAGAGFSFSVPDNYALNRVEGANEVVDLEWNWTPLTPEVDYSVNGSQITILTGAAEYRMIRVWWDSAL